MIVWDWIEFFVCEIEQKPSLPNRKARTLNVSIFNKIKKWGSFYHQVAIPWFYPLTGSSIACVRRTLEQTGTRTFITRSAPTPTNNPQISRREREEIFERIFSRRHFQHGVSWHNGHRRRRRMNHTSTIPDSPSTQHFLHTFTTHYCI